MSDTTINNTLVSPALRSGSTNGLDRSVVPAPAANRSSSASASYTDFAALQKIRQLGQADEKQALRQVAKQFESMFIGMMMSSMRQANDVLAKDSLLGSSEQKFYQSMFDDQMSLTLTEGSGTGLAETIYRQMLREYTPAPSHSANPSSTGNNSDLSTSGNRLIRPLDDRDWRSTPTIVRPDRAAVAEVSSTRTLEAMPVVDKAEINKAEVNKPIADNPDIEKAGINKTAVDITAEPGKAERGQVFASAIEFIAALYPAVKKIATKLGVEVKAILSQAALETGWGKHIIQDQQGSSFNLFGIKADRRWSGPSVSVTTHEVYDGTRVKQVDQFRAYRDLQHGLEDYAEFLQGSARYQPVLDAKPDASQYGFLLQKAGYATDPQYGEKIARIANSETMANALNRATSNALNLATSNALDQAVTNELQEL